MMRPQRVSEGEKVQRASQSIFYRVLARIDLERTSSPLLRFLS
jgi:hypothetical protein